MKTTIYCKTKTQGIHSFYLLSEEGEYFLFNQHYRKGVQNYFAKGVLLNMACDTSKSKRDNAVIKTMRKLPMYIRYIEREYEISILEKTKRKKSSNKSTLKKTKRKKNWQYQEEQYCA